MARITKLVEKPHPCREEIEHDIPDWRKLGLGTEATCSCGQAFVLRDEQRDGLYWDAVR